MTSIVERVLKACADHGVAVEINANPWRLDLDWRWHQRALELGCIFSINPDAHSIAELDLMRWGAQGRHKRGSRVERVRPAQLFTMARGPQKSHRSAEREDPSMRPSFPCPLWPICCIRPTRQNGNRHRPRSA
jgi:hypothetical protein